MDYQEMLRSINRKLFAPIYLFCGEEILLRQQVLHKLKRVLIDEQGEIGQFNYDVLEGTMSPGEIVDLANTLPVMAEKRLVVVKEPYFFQAGKNDGNSKEKHQVDDKLDLLLEYFDDPNPSTCLVFLVEGKVDTRRKIYKALRKTGQVVNFDRLKGTELHRWIEGELEKYGKRMEEPAINWLVATLGNDLGILSQELAKISAYMGSKSFISLSSVREVISRTLEAGIFQMVDAVAEKRPAAVINYLRDLLLTGETEMKILYMVVRQFRLMLQAKTLAAKGYPEKQIIQKMQAHYFVVRKALSQAANFTLEQLQKDLEQLLQLDEAIKTGRGDPSLLMEICFLRLCS